MSSNAQRTNPLAPEPGTKGIDVRGPRFGATITLITLAAELVFLLVWPLSPSAGVLGNLLTLPTLWLAGIVIIFGFGAFGGVGRSPWGLIYRGLVQPRLKPATEFENPKPPTFAQLIGFFITLVGLVFAVLGISVGALIAVAFAFIAAFLNSVFGYCLGCQIYVLLVRVGLLGKKTA